VPAQQRFDIGAASRGYRFEVRDRLAATNDGVMLATMFDAIEQIGEATGRIGGSDIWQAIRLSDSCSQVKAPATPITRYRTRASISPSARDRQVRVWLQVPQAEASYRLEVGPIPSGET
jgi:hypothetical protein